MATSYRIDGARRIVVCRAWGVVTATEARNHYQRILADPAFDHTFSELIDLREVTDFQIEVDTLRLIAEQRVFALGARRAVIAPSILQNAVASAFANYSATRGQNIQVFDDPIRAHTWLGLLSELADSLDGRADAATEHPPQTAERMQQGAR
jgi:hypothetical protein